MASSSNPDAEMGAIVASDSLEETLKRKIVKAGSKLVQHAPSTEKLLKILDKFQVLLEKVKQERWNFFEEAIRPAKDALIATDLTRHAEMGVKVTVACCIGEILRITAPDVPYDDDNMKEYFNLAVMALENLSCARHSRCYEYASVVLLNTAFSQSFILMLDLQLDDLIREMFHKFLQVIRPSHPDFVFECMEKIMRIVIQNYNEIPPELLDILLASVKLENDNVSRISFKLGRKVFENCAAVLKPYLAERMSSLGIKLDDYSDIVASLCKDAPQGHNTETKKQGNSDCLAPSNDGILRVMVETHTSPNNDEHLSENPVITSPCCDQINQQTDVVEKIDPESGQDADGNGIAGLLIDDSSKSQVNCSTAQMSNSLMTTEPVNEEINQSVPRKRNRKPNSLLKLDEGYDPLWILTGRLLTEEANSRKYQKKKTGHPLETTIPKELKISSEPVVESEKLKDLVPHQKEKTGHPLETTIPKELKISSEAAVESEKLKDVVSHQKEKIGHPLETTIHKELKKSSEPVVESDKLKDLVPHQKEKTRHSLETTIPKELKISSKPVVESEKLKDLVSQDHLKKYCRKRKNIALDQDDGLHLLVSQQKKKTGHPLETTIPKELKISSEPVVELEKLEDLVSHQKEKNGHPLETAVPRELKISLEPVVESEKLKDLVSQDRLKKYCCKRKNIAVDQDDGLYLLVSQQKKITRHPLETTIPKESKISSEPVAKSEKLKDLVSHQKEKTGHPLDTIIPKELSISSELMVESEKWKDMFSQDCLKKYRRKRKNIVVDQDDGLHLLATSASNLCKTVSSKVDAVVESSKEKLERDTDSSFYASKGNVMNKYPEKGINSSPRKTVEKSRGKTLIKVSDLNQPTVYGKELVGSKIKVWWPLDKEYYEGTVESFDNLKREHKVAYDDGDEEILDLTKERWQLIGNSNSSIHEQKTVCSSGASRDRSRNLVTKSSRPSKKKQNGNASTGSH